MTVASITATTHAAATTIGRGTSGSTGFADALAAAESAEQDERAAADRAAAERAVAAFDLAVPPDATSAATYAEGARHVSLAQGLPAGTHDFTRMTPREMTIVGGALVSGGTVGAKGLAAVFDLAARDAAVDTPINYLAYLDHEATANEKTPGGMATAFGQRAAHAVLTRIQAAQGVPIRYDDAYPTAPRAMTAEEANAKLKAAITAFRKEAAMTPAQRIRRDVLKDMKLTEEMLKTMPAAERAVAEKAIGDEVARRLALLGLADTGARSSGEMPAPEPADERAAAA